MLKRVTTLLAVAAIVASACGGSSSKSAAPTASPTPPPTGTPTPRPLILGEWQEPSSVWYGMYDNSATDVEAFGISLWSLWNANDKYQTYGQLATNVPTTTNGGVKIIGSGATAKMDVTINLIPGAQWSDGQPITCQDVADEVTWMMDPGQVGNLQGTLGWELITSVDGGTGTNCVAHFSKLYEAYLGLWTPLLPSHYLKTSSVADANKNLYKQTDLTKGVYSGPYIPTTWASGAQINYVPNQAFWSTIKKKTAPYSSVIFKYYTDATAMKADFKNGGLDVAMDLNHNDLSSLSGIPTAEVNAIDGTTYEQNSWNMAHLTSKFGAAGAKALMDALHYAYNKDDIAQRITGGTVTTTCNLFSPLNYWYKNIPCYKFDVAKANSILTAAGFSAKGSDGFRKAPNGAKLQIDACTSAGRTYRVDTLNLLKTQLAAIGVDVTVHPVPSTNGGMFPGWNDAPADQPCNITHGNFDMAEFAWVVGVDPLGNYQTYYSTYDPSLGDHSGNNVTRTNIKAIDNALNTGLNSVDPAAIKAAMGTFQDIYVEPANAFPEIPLYYWKTVVLVSPTVHGLLNNATSATNTWNIEDWTR